MDEGKETPDGQRPGAPSDDGPIPAEDSISAFSAPPGGAFPLEFAEDFQGDSNAYELTDEQQARRSELYRAATHYWELGFRVIPLPWVEDGQCSCGTPDCPSPGKHPTDEGWQVPGKDPDADARWWRMLSVGETNPVDWRPAANIGILTGSASRVLVVDLDEGGDITLGNLEAEHPEEPIPDTFRVRTGSGGSHLYFRYPPEMRIHNRKPWGKTSGIDIKGDRGQCAAPPSVSGFGPYSYVQDVTSFEEIAWAPSWILDALRVEEAIQAGEGPINVAVIPDKVIRRYIEATIRGVAKDLSLAPVHERNNTLNKSAWRLGRFGAHGLITEAEAWQALHETAITLGLTHKETVKTFSSGWRSGLEEPANLSEVGQLTTEHDWRRYSWTEFGMADRLVQYFGHQLRWIAEREQWMTYESGIWKPCSEAEAQRMAQDMLRLMPETEAPGYSDEPYQEGETSPRAKFLSWHRAQLTRAKVVTTVKLARDRPAIRASAARLDERPLLINLRNGTFDAEEGELLPHQPERLLTMQGAVAYDKNATCPLWDEFLARMQPEEEMRAFLYRAWGYSLTADLGERAFFLHHGPTATGKSVMNNVMSFIAGTYSQTVPVETLLLTGQTGAVPTDIARMDGKRYLSASETRAGKVLNEALVKQLTGGDTMAARFMRQDFFEFRPTGKIHLISNHVVHLSNDSATEDRVHMIQWAESVPKRQRDKTFAAKIIRTEAPGVLNRVLAGLADWAARGSLAPPQKAEEHKTEFLCSEDWRIQFVEHCLMEVAYQKGVVGRSTDEIYQVFRFWWGENNPGTRVLSKTTFSAALKELYPYCETQVPVGGGKRKHWRGFPTLEVIPFFMNSIQH